MDAHGRSERLHALYAEIHRCQKCFGMLGCRMQADTERAPRRVFAEAFESEVMVVGEALGAQTQRLSGVPYLRPDGSWLDTGKTLDNLLRHFGHSIFPNSGRRYAYSTDAVQRWPGLKPNGGNRKPSRQEVANCAEWLEEEIVLVRPRVVLVMGRPAAQSFLPRYVGVGFKLLKEVAGIPYEAEIRGHRFVVYAIQHPSPLAQGPERTETYKKVAPEIAAMLVG